MSIRCRCAALERYNSHWIAIRHSEAELNTPIVEVDNLSRSFGEVEAVRRVSFTVDQGEIFGFLGPNGAGKTTTIHMLCSLIRPGGGRASVAGHDVHEEPHAVRRALGMVFQDPSVDEQLTARENLRFHAMLYNMDRSDFLARAEMLLALVDLGERADDKVETFSGGMKRRLEVARGLMHRPKVLFLDEPTLGLDPQTRRHIWDYLLELRQNEQITIFMTTLYMDEAEHCDRVAIMDHGEIVALDSPQALKAVVGGDVIMLQTSDNARALDYLNSSGEARGRLGPTDEVILEVDAGEAYIPEMMRRLERTQDPVEVQSVSLRRPTLEDVFIKLTGRAIRDSSPSAVDRMSARVRQRRRRG